jgi:hypothetical protein
MIELLLEILVELGTVLVSWRFYLCVTIVAIVIAAIHWWMPDSPLRFALQVTTVAIGVVWGVVWEWRAS